MIELGKVYKVKDQQRYVRTLSEYTNGYDTTGGFYSESSLEPTDCVSVTYGPYACTELPVDWPNMWWLGDNDKRQKIIEINYGSDYPYIMMDGTKSQEVTG